MAPAKPITRRDFAVLAGAAALAPLVPPAFLLPATAGKSTMYGLIGRIIAVAGQRDALAKILLDGTGDMPGCLSYIIATDASNPDALWVTEVWDSRESHQASLALPSVQAAIAKGRPLIAGFDHRVETTPLGGHGLTRGAGP